MKFLYLADKLVSHILTHFVTNSRIFNCITTPVITCSKYSKIPRLILNLFNFFLFYLLSIVFFYMPFNVYYDFSSQPSCCSISLARSHTILLSVCYQITLILLAISSDYLISTVSRHIYCFNLLKITKFSTHILIIQHWFYPRFYLSST